MVRFVTQIRVACWGFHQSSGTIHRAPNRCGWGEWVVMTHRGACKWGVHVCRPSYIPYSLDPPSHVYILTDKHTSENTGLRLLASSNWNRVRTHTRPIRPSLWRIYLHYITSLPRWLQVTQEGEFFPSETQQQFVKCCCCRGSARQDRPNGMDFNQRHSERIRFDVASFPAFWHLRFVCAHSSSPLPPPPP